MSKGNIFAAVFAAIATIVISFMFMDVNVSQEANARNIEEIPKILNRLETLEEESSRYRGYYLEMQAAISASQVELQTVSSRQVFFLESLDRIESRFFDYIIKAQDED